MKKLKIYIDTSVINHLLADEVPERMKKTNKFWEYLREGEYKGYISELVVAEIVSCPEPKKSKLEYILYNTVLFKLEITDEVVDLAEKYINEGLFPQKYRDDAVHVALATVYGCNVLVSWNFKHMVKLKTIFGVNGINKMLGYASLEIVTPEFFTGEEESEDE